MNLFSYLIYFGAGILQDIAVTIYYKLISDNKPFAVSVASFILTVINMAILYSIVSTLDPNESILMIIIFGLGNAVGAFLAVKYYPEKKK